MYGFQPQIRSITRPLPLTVGGNSFITNFPATENPLSQGGIWTNGLAVGLAWNDMQTTPGLAFGTATSAEPDVKDNIATVQGLFSPTKHFVEATVFKTGSDPLVSLELEFLVGTTITANSSKLYACVFPFNNSSIVHGRWNGPYNDFKPGGLTIVSGTDFYSGGAVHGDVMRVIYDSTSGSPIIALFINGVQQLVLTDTDAGKHMTGNPGIGVFARPGATLANYGFSNFTCGNA